MSITTISEFTVADCLSTIPANARSLQVDSRFEAAVTRAFIAGARFQNSAPIASVFVMAELIMQQRAAPDVIRYTSDDPEPELPVATRNPAFDGAAAGGGGIGGSREATLASMPSIPALATADISRLGLPQASDTSSDTNSSPRSSDCARAAGAIAITAIDVGLVGIARAPIAATPPRCCGCCTIC